MFFTVKLASLLLAVAASAQASIVTRDDLAALAVTFFDDVNFTGAAYSPIIVPALCQDLPADWFDRAESVLVGTGSTCTFFTTFLCDGTGTQLSGSVTPLPDPPLLNNIKSFRCIKTV